MVASACELAISLRLLAGTISSSELMTVLLLKGAGCSSSAPTAHPAAARNSSSSCWNVRDPDMLLRPLDERNPTSCSERRHPARIASTSSCWSPTADTDGRPLPDCQLAAQNLGT